MNDPDADSQPTPRIEGGTQTGETSARSTSEDTQRESLRKPKIERGEVWMGPSDDRDDRLLDFLAQWEQRYCRGEDASPESLGVNDPELLEALRERTERQKRLYAFLKHSPAEPVADPGVLPGHPPLDPPLLAGVDGDRAANKSIPEPCPSSIGRYRVIRVLGEGGFGRVYLAHDAELERDVAIKMPVHSQASWYLDVESYLEEARIIARLSHPNIVPVYDVGRTEDDHCYVVSKYMDGGDLAARLRRGRLAVAEAAELIAVLCEALHYTHTHDLFHRDIKPANILLDAHGVPYLADFGLALKDENLGKGARHLGTAAYMSPEQARGEAHRVDGRSDIFSLGVVLYELMTGRRPFRGSSKDQVMEQIIYAEPRPLRQIDDTIPRELERICLKALSKRASERYATARDLAEDLRHFLESKLRTMSMHGVSPAAKTVSTPTTTEGSPTPIPASSDSILLSIRIVPKGLGSFDENDADFFLDLLPGPRDREGLPEGLRFWKTRIEATDPDKTFRVGLIYGPSGCGKSSLVKAGLLPLLGQHIATIYVEATAGETEARLLRGVRKRFPSLPADVGLVETLASLRRDQSLTQDRKVVVVLDQFEQWLFAHHGEPAPELVAALRQCDGEHLQALCLVRDDFWMAATRLMRDLEIDLVPDRNVAAVDLFDPKHARKVLAAYGRAYEALPPRADDLTREQRAFLDQAVDGLAQDSRVVPVRLALFAEMVKRKAWVPATLREVGGMDGVGVTFLEETFSSPRANPNHRYHQKAAQSVLKALLPESNTDLKGRMRSIEELRGLSGYGARPADFIDLIRMLDNELRLITPVDPEGSIDEDVPVNAAAVHCYQLTHDYLVHALREWFTRKQRETRQGRAELLLAERTAQWIGSMKDQHLPSPGEWLSIRLRTRPNAWTEMQRRMMRRGRWIHGTRIFSLGLLIAVVLAITQAYSVYSRTQELLVSLPGTKVENIPNVLKRLAVYPRWVYSRRLQDLAKRPGDDPRSRFAYSLALLPDDPGQLDYLYQRLREADPVAMAVLRECLTPYRGELKGKLWSALREARLGDECILPVASVLARYDPSNRGWSEVVDKIARAMVGAKLDQVTGWREALADIRSKIIDPLSRIYREEHRPIDEHEFAAHVLAQYTENDPRRLVDLLLDSNPKSFSILFPVVEENVSQTSGELRDAVKSVMIHRMPDPRVPPDEDDRTKDARASRGAKAAATLVRLGHGEEAWQLLDYSPDPRVRSAFIAAINTLVPDPAVLVAELDRLDHDFGIVTTKEPLAKEKNNYLFDPVISRRRALIQTLAGYPKESLETQWRDAMVTTLVELYRNNPDAGIHAAAELVLRRWGYQDRLRIEPRRAPRTVEPGHNRWYVNQEGQTMVLVDGPVEFDMGTPPSDPDWQEEEVRHHRKIPRRFFIGSKEVTVDEFQRYARAERGVLHEYSRKYSMDPDSPVINLSWFEAVGYCNWLSDKEHLPRCYKPNGAKEFAEGMQIDAEAVAQGGYRLLTEAEHEYACRAGTVTSRYYGHSVDLLGRYEWYTETSGYRAHPCGSLLPNDLGLFDMLGNVMEWCHDRHQEFKLNSNTIIEDIIVSEDVHGEKRHIRSDKFSANPLSLRSASRGWFDPGDRSKSELGFRVARSCP